MDKRVKDFIDLANSNPSTGELAATMAMLVAVLTPEQQQSLQELQALVAEEIRKAREAA